MHVDSNTWKQTSEENTCKVVHMYLQVENYRDIMEIEWGDMKVHIV